MNTDEILQVIDPIFAGKLNHAVSIFPFGKKGNRIQIHLNKIEPEDLEKLHQAFEATSIFRPGISTPESESWLIDQDWKEVKNRLKAFQIRPPRRQNLLETL